MIGQLANGALPRTLLFFERLDLSVKARPLSTPACFRLIIPLKPLPIFDDNWDLSVLYGSFRLVPGSRLPAILST